MKVNLFTLLLLLCGTMLLNSCNKDENNLIEPKFDNENLEVYIAGYIGNTATYWKDGVPVSLTDGTTKAEAHSIHVANGNVYVAGYEYEDSNRVAKLWINGNPTSLSDSGNFAMAHYVFVSDDDVYVSGFEFTGERGTQEYHSVPKYWKNGIEETLNNEEMGAGGVSIFVNGENVYVSGYSFTSEVNLRAKACYWKNGNPVYLTDGNFNAEGDYILVDDDGNIHIAGIEQTATSDDNYIATYWKNGQRIQLTDGITDARANGMFIDDDDVYIVGANGGFNGSNYKPVYWKNGSLVQLPYQGKSSVASEIAVVDDIVYAVGYVNKDSGDFLAKYWIDGKSGLLTDGSENARAKALFIVEK